MITKTNAVPVVGQSITVRGLSCTITKIHPFGTLDVRTPSGAALRVTGLPFRKCGHCGGAYPLDQSCICFDNNCQ